MINEFRTGDGASIVIPPAFGVFCDMDGTLVDTDYANYLSYRRAVVEATQGMHDVNFTGERLNRETLKKRLPPLTVEQLEVITSLKAEYFSGFLSQTRLNAELAHLITKHRGKNLIVLVTYCREKRAVEVLEHHKILQRFTRLICREDLHLGISSNKYKSAIELTRIRREAVLIFENDSNEIKQAELAGVPKRNIYRVLPWNGKYHEPISN